MILKAEIFYILDKNNINKFLLANIMFNDCELYSYWHLESSFM